MSIIVADAKGLEWRVAMYFSQDSVGIPELINGSDIHEDNQKKFNLPSRIIAKRFIFKLIYGGTDYGFSIDPELNFVSKDKKFWAKVIESTYSKYKGLHAWHTKLMQDVNRNWFLEIPSGRRYNYEPVMRQGCRVPYRPKVLNYPVQGFSADIMMVARISLYRRLVASKRKALLINTVHDSIMLDSPKEEVYTIAKMIDSVFEDLPRNLSRLFNINYNVPMEVETKIGINWGNLRKINSAEM